MRNTHSLQRLGILFHNDPGQYDIVRHTSAGLLAKVRYSLLKKLSPSSFRVRGDFVAVDSLIEALLRRGTMSHYDVFCAKASVNAVRTRLISRGLVDADRVSVSSTDTLRRNEISSSVLALLGPSISFAEAFRMRESVTSRVLPVISLSHGLSLPAMLYDTVLRLLLTNTYPCDSLICTSTASKAALTALLENVSASFNDEFKTSLQFHGRIDRLPLCIDTDSLKPLDKDSCRRSLGLSEDSFVLLYMGRISPLKADLYPLLSVFEALLKNNRPRKLKLLIAGTRHESYTTQIESFIRGRSLDRDVKLISNFSDQEKAAILSAADIFVSPADSLQESFGLSPIEAMACGVPQVVSDWDGYRDTVVHGETGFLVPTYWSECDDDLTSTNIFYGPEFDHRCLGQSVAIDLRILQANLQTLISNDELRLAMSERSRSHAESVYSYGAVATQYEDLSRELSLIADIIPARRAVRKFDQPHYFHCFQSYPSAIINDRTELRIAHSLEKSVDSPILSLLQSRHSWSHLLEEAIVRSALEILLSNEGDGGRRPMPMTLGLLMDQILKVTASQRTFVQRNIMWLIKQGLVEVSLPE